MTSRLLILKWEFIFLLKTSLLYHFATLETFFLASHAICVIWFLQMLIWLCFLVCFCLFFSTSLCLHHLLTAPHKTKRQLTNCDFFVAGPPLGIMPNGCCAKRVTPSPNAMEVCQGVQVTFTTPWMQALLLKEDTSNLFLLSNKERLIWREEGANNAERRIPYNKQTKKQTKHTATGCQSGLRRCSWICGCPCCWCGLLVFCPCLWLLS